MISELQIIPGIGKDMETHLTGLGYGTVESLRGANPQEMYDRDCIRCGMQLDRCVLYVFRCAVYYAETAEPEPEKCKWWYWKDHQLEREEK
ncbi:helix-hairpin-helix domain-containing protein [Anaerotruncus rubiinfantis]|uniref:helix-hairpin-helix domain-containing protein n=1 Tax=Anaerotruncus rubiinfantis TaxID=1720200 RepID=UPI000B13B6DE